jgi:hypothetical protein
MAGVDRPGALVCLFGVVAPLTPLLLRSYGITRLPPAALVVVEEEVIKFMKLMMAVDFLFSLSKKIVPGGY